MTSSQKILLSLILTSFLVTGCATSYSKEELRTVDNALRTGDGGHLTGKLGYLYRKESRKLRVEQAARNRDPSNLDRLELVMYNREVSRQVRAADRQEYDRLRTAEKQRKAEFRAAEKKRQEDKRLAKEEVRLAKEQKLADEAAKEEQRLAAIAAREEEKRLVQLDIENRKKARAQARQQKIAEAERVKFKAAQPLHPEWGEDMRDLTAFLKQNDFEPAHRLVDVYARTMQFLVHISPDADQFSEFYAGLTDSEKLDHRRLFQDGTGQDLLAQFWSSHERVDRIPALGSN